MPHGPIRRAFLIVLLLSCLPALAQEPAPALNPDSFYGRDSTQSVYVRDSAVAMEKFTLAQRMERLKEWDKSADVYQEILDKYADRVVPSQVDQDNSIYQYSSVSLAVQERLAKWPQDGLDYYRGRYGAEAESALEGTGPDDYASLHRIYSRYFVTDAGKSAGLRLMALYLEAGEFPAAAWLGDRLLSWHPNLQTERPEVLYRTSLAYHLAGNAKLAAERQRQLEQDHADAIGIVRGEDVALAKSLQEQLSQAPPMARIVEGDSWPMFGGSADRSRVMPSGASPGARLFGVELPEPDYSTFSNAQDRRQREAQDQRDRSNGLTLGIMPVIDDGELYFQDGARLYALSLQSGVPLPGWAQRPDGRTNTRRDFGARTNQTTVTLTDDSVLAVMGQSVRNGMMMGMQPRRDRGSYLVCIDRRTGVERWRKTPRQLPESAGAVRDTELVGSPLVIGNNVFVTARGGQGMQFEDCYVLCLDRTTGEFRWSCYLASASTGIPIWAGEMDMPAMAVPQMAYASGRLYVLTNLGALAAVDAYGGTILWLNIYPRDGAHDLNQLNRLGRFGGVAWDAGVLARLSNPWNYSPPIIHEGRAFLLPSDGKHLLVYDAGSGVELKRIARSAIDHASTLLGLFEGRPIVCSDSKVACLNWEQFDPTRKIYENLFWRSELADIRGRGFITAEDVFIPTVEALHRINLSSGKVVERYPANRAWGDAEEPGNIVVVGDQVVIAGSTRVNVYTDLALARSKLDKELAAAPTDPQPRLRYAEVMFAAGQPDVALQKLDEAIALLGGADAMREGPAQARIFSDSLNFALKLGEQSGSESGQLIEQFFDRAKSAAASPSEHVQYLLARAEHYAQQRKLEPAVELYQQVLREAPYREVTVLDDSSGGLATASTVAFHAIERLIREHGRAIYSGLGAEAERALAEATESRDPARLIEVAEVYPNSQAAPGAMLAAAEVFEARQDHRQATQLLRQVLRRFPEGPQQPRLVEALARNYLNLPNGVDVAIARLAQSVKLESGVPLEKPMTLPDGTVLKGIDRAAALQALRDYQSRLASRRLPDFGLPIAPARPVRGQRLEPFLPPTPDTIIEGIAQLVIPLPELARHDRVVTWSNGQLAVYEVGQTSPLFAAEGPREQAVGYGWVGPTLIAWSGGQVMALEGTDGKVYWRTGLESLPPAERLPISQEPAPEVMDANLPAEVNLPVELRRALIALPAPVVPKEARAAERIHHVRPLTDRVVFTTTAGRLAALDLRSGQLAWQARVSTQPIHQLVANDDFTAVRVLDDAAFQIAALNSFDGSVVVRWTFADGGNIPLNMALSADGTLVYTLPNHVCGKDLFEPGIQLTFNMDAGGNNGQRFVGAVKPGQLVIAEGRIVALCDGGRFVQVRSLTDGKLIEYPSEESDRSIDAMLPTKSSNWDVTLHHVGPRLYVVGGDTLVAYNLDRPQENWEKPRDELLGQDRREHFLATFIGQDYLVLLDRPTPKDLAQGIPVPQAIARGQGTRTHRLSALSRMTLPASEGRESGRWDYIHWLDFGSPIAENQWQAVDGGFYFRTEENKLHFLRGAEE